MSKEKLIEIIDGIRVTKPWNEDMYKHNDKVASEMKERIMFAANEFYKIDDEFNLRLIAESICAYGFGQGYDLDEIHHEIFRELDNIQNYWLNDVYPDMVKKGLVEPTTINFVGYKK